LIYLLIADIYLIYYLSLYFELWLSQFSTNLVFEICFLAFCLLILYFETSMNSKKVPLICSGHSRPIPELNYSRVTADGFFLISACFDGKPMLRNGETGDWIGTFIGHKGAVNSAHLNSTASKAVTGSADYSAKIWNALTGDEMHTFAHKKIVKSVRFSNDDQMVLTGGQDGILRIFSIEKLDLEPTTLETANQVQPIRSCSWLGNDGNDHTIVVAQDNSLKIWDMRSKQIIKSYTLNANISGLEVSLDKKHFVTTADKEVGFWNIETLELEKSLTMPITVNSASFNLNGTQFVVGGADCTVRVYDYSSGKELEVHKGHHGPVHCVRHAPDGNTFASGSEDGTIRILQTELKAYGLWQEKEGSEIPTEN